MSAAETVHLGGGNCTVVPRPEITFEATPSGLTGTCLGVPTYHRSSAFGLLINHDSGRKPHSDKMALGSENLFYFSDFLRLTRCNKHCETQNEAWEPATKLVPYSVSCRTSILFIRVHPNLPNNPIPYVS
jgi:hypothetical protein